MRWLARRKVQTGDCLRWDGRCRGGVWQRQVQAGNSRGGSVAAAQLQAAAAPLAAKQQAVDCPKLTRRVREGAVSFHVFGGGGVAMLPVETCLPQFVAAADVPAPPAAACCRSQTGVAPKLLPELHMSNNGPFGITSFALSLLLVFRHARCAAQCCAVLRCAMLPIVNQAAGHVRLSRPPACPRKLTRCLRRHSAALPACCDPPSDSAGAAACHCRTNASYARWLDARRAWGLLLNRSRDITRCVCVAGWLAVRLLVGLSSGLAAELGGQWLPVGRALLAGSLRGLSLLSRPAQFAACIITFPTSTRVYYIALVLWLLALGCVLGHSARSHHMPSCPPLLVTDSVRCRPAARHPVQAGADVLPPSRSAPAGHAQPLDCGIQASPLVCVCVYVCVCCGCQGVSVNPAA